MSAIVVVTPKPRRVTGAEVAAESEALEVLGFSKIRLQLRLRVLESPSTPTFKLQMLHSMVLADLQFYTPASVLVTLSAANTSEPLLIEAPLRYLRWEVVALTGASAAVFELDGIAWTA